MKTLDQILDDLKDDLGYVNASRYAHQNIMGIIERYKQQYAEQPQPKDQD